MFIRETKKQNSKEGKVFYQYSLMQSARVDGKSRQRTVLYLGSDTELRGKESRTLVAKALESRITGSGLLFDDLPPSLEALVDKYYQKYEIRYADLPEGSVSLPPQGNEIVYEKVATEAVEVADSRSFGAEYLCLQTLDKLKMANLLTGLAFTEEQVKMALTTIISRAVFRASEHKTSQILSMNSSLGECAGLDKSPTYKQLYHIADLLYAHKQQIDKALYDHIVDLFSLEDAIVIYDISNTYFESSKPESKLAAYGRSKEKRYDCPIVTFTGVINPEGFIRHSRIYEGNKPEGETLKDMIADLEKYAKDKEQKTIVMDAGIATEQNLEMLDKMGYKYVCVSRKRIKDYPTEILNHTVTELTDRKRDHVKLSVFTPEGYHDTWMLVQSKAKRKKEQSMQDKLCSRFEEDLSSVEKALHKKGGTKRIGKVWERIGRYKERHKNVSGRYEIKVEEKEGKAVAMSWQIKDDKIKQDKAEGYYFIRTNLEGDESALWNIYNTIRNVESTFRCLKTDLNIRPVYHQKDERIEAHLYLAILAYQLVNTIRYQLRQEGITYDWSNILRIMSTQRVQTVEMPTENKTIYLRKASKPIREVSEIYKATGCKDTKKTLRKYVVYH